jgi:hypothetical protein
MFEAMPEGPPDDAAATITPLASGSSLMGFVDRIPALSRSALRNAWACAKNAIDSLSVAIGKPPRRPFEDPDAPSGLPWAADIAILCFALAAVMVVMAFATMPSDCGSSEDQDVPLAAVTVEQTGFAKYRTKFIWVLLVAIFPAVGGAVLNVQHPVIPALLRSL